MRKLLVLCICTLLSVPVAMAGQDAAKKKMEAVKAQTNPQSVEKVSALKKGDGELRKLGGKEEEITAECCGTRPGAPPPKPEPDPEPPVSGCEEGVDPDCDDDEDEDTDTDTDGPGTGETEVQTQNP